MPLLPKGTRVDDAPEQHGVHGVRFRLALAARKYPIQIALLIALAVAAVPVWLLVDASKGLKSATADVAGAQHRVTAAQKKLQAAVEATTASRKASSASYCRAINRNAKANNGQTDYFIALTRKNLKNPPDHKPITPDQRKQAEQFITRIGTLKIKPLDCKIFQAKIEADVKRIQKAGVK